VAVSLVHPSPVEVGEPSKLLGPQRFNPATHLGKGFLGLRIRQIGEGLGTQTIDC
jgi:hypothetical protein